MTILFAGGEVDAFKVTSPTDVIIDTSINRHDSDFAVNGAMAIQNNALVEAIFTAQTSGWVHFVFALESKVSTQDTLIFQLMDEATNIEIARVELTNGDIECRYFSTATKIGASVVSAVDTTYTFDIFFNMHDTTGSIEFHIDGALARSVSGVDTLPSGITDVSKIRFTPARVGVSTASGRTIISEVIIATTSTIGMRVATVSPSAAGTTGAWTGAYTDVDDLVVADDANFLQSSTANQVTTLAATNLSVAAAAMNVEAVVECARCKNTASGPQNIQHALRTAATDYFSSNIATLTTAFAGFYNVRETNPNTASAWTTSEVDGMEIGVKSIT